MQTTVCNGNQNHLTGRNQIVDLKEINVEQTPNGGIVISGTTAWKGINTRYSAYLAMDWHTALDVAKAIKEVVGESNS